MITFDQLMNSNLEMLNEQEAMILKSLAFIRRAKEIFKTNGSEIIEPKPRKRRRKQSARREKSPVIAKEEKATKKPGKGTHLDRILSVLQSAKGPMSSGEIIDSLFKDQTASKDIAKFRQIIYPTLTQAYKKGTLKNKKRKIYLS